MMGGIDTVMPDKIVKRVINEILVKAGLKPVNDDIDLYKRKILSYGGYSKTDSAYINHALREIAERYGDCGNDLRCRHNRVCRRHSRVCRQACENF